MRNKSTEATEKKLRAIEKEVRKIYKEAYKGITEKWSKYMRTVEASAADRKEAWELAKKENGENSPEAQEAKKAYTEYLKQATVVNSRFKTMQQETAQKITQRNQIAAQYVNGEMASVYISNYNETAKVRHAVTGYNFTEVNEATVAKLITNKKDSLLPQSEIDIPKDMAWNKQKMTGQVLQGILQGEGIPQISKRLQNVVGMNAASAVRNARTMITAAQNRGRLDQMKQQQKMGIRVQKEWLATKDRRTRDSHAELDGERVDLNKPFSNGLMQPGDPAGEPAEVYNCRCTLVYYYPDFDMDAEEADRKVEDDEEAESVEINTAQTQDYKNYEFEEQAEAERRGEETVIKYHKITNAENELYISEEVKRKPRTIHAIDNAMTNAIKRAGIEGRENLPKVIIVNQREMGKAAIATYSPTKNVILILEDFANQKSMKGLREYFAGTYKESTIVHELQHWKTAEKYTKLFGPIKTEGDYFKYLEWANREAKKELDVLTSRGYNVVVSRYAKESQKKQEYAEVLAEYNAFRG